MMNIYRLLHITLLISLLGYLLSLLCAVRYRNKCRRKAPEKAVHEAACAAQKRLTGCAVRWGCAFALIDAAVCFGLWLVSDASGESLALLQLLNFGRIALPGGCICHLLQLLVEYSLDDGLSRRIIRRARWLPRTLVLLGLAAMLFTAFMLI